MTFLASLDRFVPPAPAARPDPISPDGIRFDTDERMKANRLAFEEAQEAANVSGFRMELYVSTAAGPGDYRMKPVRSIGRPFLALNPTPDAFAAAYEGIEEFDKAWIFLGFADPDPAPIGSTHGPDAADIEEAFEDAARKATSERVAFSVWLTPGDRAPHVVRGGVDARRPGWSFLGVRRPT